MRIYMKKSLLGLSMTAFAVLASMGSAQATDGADITVDFTANIRETTCDMKLSGGVGSDTQQTLTLGGSKGEVRLNDVKSGNVSADFKLMIVECPSSLTSLKTTIKGQASTDLATGFVNQISKDSGGADYAAIEIARESTPDAPFTPNATADAQRLVWTSEEINNKELPLVATLRETKANQMTTGSFQTVATFEFTYE